MKSFCSSQTFFMFPLINVKIFARNFEGRHRKAKKIQSKNDGKVEILLPSSSSLLMLNKLILKPSWKMRWRWEVVATEQNEDWELDGKGRMMDYKFEKPIFFGKTIKYLNSVKYFFPLKFSKFQMNLFMRSRKIFIVSNPRL